MNMFEHEQTPTPTTGTKLPELRLLPPLVDGGNPVLLIDNSTLDLYTCPREGEYAHIRNWVANNEKAALNFGAACHEGWRWRYTVCGSAKLDEPAQLAQNEIIQRHFDAKPQPENDHRQPSLALECMARYNDLYQQEQWEIVKNPKTGKRAVEQSVMCFLATMPIVALDGHTSNLVDVYYTGRIDLIISDCHGLWCMDHKTTFQFGESFSSTMSMTDQMPGYAWAWQQMTGELLTGYIINAIRVRRPTPAAQLAEDFFRIGGKDTDFQRLPFYLNQDRIDEWKENAIARVETILHHHAIGNFPMNRTQCVRKWGKCQFFDVCSAQRGSRLDILEQTQAYIQNDWSPLNKPEEPTV